MNLNPPSIARQASLVATAMLATLLSEIVSLVIIHLSMFAPAKAGPSIAAGLLLTVLLPYTLIFCGTTLLASLLLVRFARFRKRWHAALLTVIAYVMLCLVLYSKWTRRLFDLPFLHPPGWEFPWRIYGVIGLIHAAQVAIAFCAYRLLWRRRSADDTARPATSTETPPAAVASSRFGTPRELRTFVLILASFILIGSGALWGAHEILLRQVPAPVWRLLRESREMEFLTLRGRSSAPGEFHGHTVTSRSLVTTPRERAAAVAGLRRAVTGWAGTLRLSLNDPATHAIRLRDGTKTYDLLLKFPARWLTIYEGDQVIGGAALNGSLEELKTLVGSGMAPLKSR